MSQKITKIELYNSIKNAIENARQFTAKTVNSTMVKTYWEIGRLIVEDEQEGKTRAVFGGKVLEKLSIQLSKEFGKGFDVSNLRNMRKFYIIFPIRDAVRHELSWTHYRTLIRIEKPKARQFYLKESIEGNWSTRQLNRQINSFFYERMLSSKDKQQLINEVKTNQTNSSTDFVKDPFVLEFLNLKDVPNLAEKDIEKSILDNLQQFLLELGKGFSFVGRQKRITSATGKHFYTDLVFYNYILKCFVLFDLKMGELTHQDIGQMDMYVRYYEDKIKNPDDNPTIGIILCSEKDQTIVKYSVLEESQQLFASKYKLYLPSEEELAKELEREIAQIRLLNGLNR